MKVLFDECMPRPLRRLLPGFDIFTTQEMGWVHFKNGDLLAQAEGKFDAFLTADQNLKYQQNLTGRDLAILVVPTNRLPALRRNSQAISDALHSLKKGDYFEVQFPSE